MAGVVMVWVHGSDWCIYRKVDVAIHGDVDVAIHGDVG